MNGKEILEREREALIAALETAIIFGPAVGGSRERSTAIVDALDRYTVALRAAFREMEF